MEYIILANNISKAWTLLCKECAGDLHQFDHWDNVPKYVQDMYIEKVQ